MKYLITVKREDSNKAEIYEFETVDDRSDFYNQIKEYESVQDISFSQMEG